MITRNHDHDGYPTEVIGARPGEKLHESLIGPDESRTTHDYGDHYRILPAFRRVMVESGELVPDGFTYSSDRAPMEVDDLRRVLSVEAAA